MQFYQKQAALFRAHSHLSPFPFKKSLSVELFDFFSKVSLPAATKSAFVQRRKLIKAIFFKDFFFHTTSVFYKRFKTCRWNGFRLLSIDGTACRVPNEPELLEFFGKHTNQHTVVPSCRWLIVFDLLNKIIVNVILHQRKQGEITVAMPLVQHFAKDDLVIYDRGFDGTALLYLHQKFNSNCIIRTKTTFNATVIDFVQSTHKERIVVLKMGERAVRALKKLGHEISQKDMIRVRLIRIELETGEIEVLMTTLLDLSKYPHKEFKKLYNKRWGVETSIFVLKSYFQAAVFASYTLPGVSQEIWANFAMYNLQTILITAQQKDLERIARKRKFNYQINRNIGVGLIKRFFPILFSSKIKNWYAKVKALLKELLRHLEPIRLRESRLRKRKILRGNERHIYESNYKPTL